MDSRKPKKPGNKQQKTFFSKSGELNPKDNTTAPPPRILLKAKEKENVPKKVEPTITIVSKNPTVKMGTDQQAPSGNKDSAAKQKTAGSHQEIPQSITVVSSMTKSVNLVSGNNTLNVHAFDYLLEGNSDFAVIGAVGMQGAGKSTVLNLLASSPKKEDIEQVLFYVGQKAFPVYSALDQRDSSGLEDEIQMHITRDRIILLDSAPVLANRCKKDFIASELDDIRRIMLLLSVCHVLVVLQEDYFNINFIRLLLCAEMMIQKDQKDAQMFNARIVFVKNKCTRKQMDTKESGFEEKLYRNLFKGSNLRIYTSKGDYNQVDLLHVPKFTHGNELYSDQEDYLTAARSLRQRILMTSRRDAVDGQENLTEKAWSQIVTHVLESHHNNYFLRKYENLKEKYNLHNHVNVVENASKDKTYLNFVDT